MRVAYDWYFWGAIFAVISIIFAIFCIVHGKGISHKILTFFASLLCVVAMVCFGGEAVLNHFGMGWRCTPFNAMLGLCSVLFIPVLLCGIWQLIHLYEDRNPALIRCGVCSMLLAIVIIPMSSFIYWFGSSWSDCLIEYDDQTIIYASNGNGSAGERRYYIHINDMVHGVEITQDGWRGGRPWDRAS